MNSTLALIAERAKAQRIELGLRQDELASEAGVSVSTVKALESGKSISMANFVKLLKPLECLGALEEVIPAPAPNPIDLLKLDGKKRQRVR